MIILDTNKGDRVLMDNHQPKKHHYHLKEMDFDYTFNGIEQLFEDFEKLIFKPLGVKI